MPNPKLCLKLVPVSNMVYPLHQFSTQFNRCKTHYSCVNHCRSNMMYFFLLTVFDCHSWRFHCFHSVHFLQQVINSSDPVICESIIFGCVKVSLIGITAFRYSFLSCCMVSRIWAAISPLWTESLLPTHANLGWIHAIFILNIWLFVLIIWLFILIIWLFLLIIWL